MPVKEKCEKGYKKSDMSGRKGIRVGILKKGIEKKLFGSRKHYV